MTEINSLNISSTAKSALTKFDSEKGNQDGKISANELSEYLAGLKEDSQEITANDKNVLKKLLNKLKNLASNELESDEIDKNQKSSVEEDFSNSFSKASSLAKNQFLPSEIKELLFGDLMERLAELFRHFNGDYAKQTENDIAQSEIDKNKSTDTDYRTKSELSGEHEESRPVMELHESLVELYDNLHTLIYSLDGHAVKDFGVEKAEALLEELGQLIDDIEASDSYNKEYNNDVISENYGEQSDEINYQEEPDNDSTKEIKDDNKQAAPQGGKKVTNPETGKMEIVMQNGSRYDLSGRRIK